jgi:hypothetical protein
MPFRKHISTGEVRDIAQETLDLWAAANNPKGASWLPYALTAKPAFDAATQKVVAAADVFANGTYTQAWQIVPRSVPPFADAASLRIALATEGWVTVGSPTTAIADLNAWAAAHIAALGTAVQRTKAHIKWQFAGSFAFDDPLIVHFATRDSKTVAQRGALFIAAEDIS